ncbi:MAG: cupredoxin domain-containing protein [Candidatus Methylopumilus sp.]|nr:cupredoxin domain-containing protein [Candidatus Methylopumilus sp.]
MKKLIFTASLLLSNLVFSAEQEVTLTIENHQMQPSAIEIPADKKIKLILINKDNTPEEFESYDLAREKIIPANSTSDLYIGPLKPGRYEFHGELHPKTAKGEVIVK